MVRSGPNASASVSGSWWSRRSGRHGYRRRDRSAEAALAFGTGRPVLIVPAAPLVSLPETIVIAWKAAPEAAQR